MITKLLPNKPLVRETSSFDRTDVIVVELQPRYLEIRTKGARNPLSRHIVPYEVLLDFARKRTADQIRATTALANRKNRRAS